MGCPAICRDEIKEETVHATGDYVAAPGDELALRRRAHSGDQETHRARHGQFQWNQLDLPELRVDSSDGYRPGLDQVVALANDYQQDRVARAEGRRA
jgi:hypothetical protein